MGSWIFTETKRSTCEFECHVIMSCIHVRSFHIISCRVVIYDIVVIIIIIVIIIVMANTCDDRFDNGADPRNARPLDLSQYGVEADYNQFPRGNTTAISYLNKVMAGQSEFSVLDLATSDFDLVAASKKFRFFLIPRILNEIKPLKMIEFMCTDEEAYKKWLNVFRKGCRWVQAAIKLNIRALFDLARIDILNCHIHQFAPALIYDY